MTKSPTELAIEIYAALADMDVDSAPDRWSTLEKRSQDRYLRTVELLRADQSARIQDLLESNNRYLERARKAEAERDALQQAVLAAAQFCAKLAATMKEPRQ